MEFSLKEIMDLLIKRVVLISVCTFTGLCVFFVISRYIMKPSYTASVQMYVIPDASTDSVNINELDYAQKVVTTYINILQTKVFFKQVIEECNLNYTQEKLKKSTNIQIINNTEIFQISVTTHHPDESFKIVETMQKIAPKLIENIKDAAAISIVDPVVLPMKPSGPNILLNTIIGGMLGFVLSVLASFLWEIIDTNVKNQEDLLKRYQLPILGVIPNFDLDKKEKHLFSNVLLTLGNHKKFRRIEESIIEDKKFIITEAYKSLRTNLRFTLRQNECKKVIISSPLPQEGKSTTAANIAITIAQTGAKVLLMDCDLRKGRLHSFFRIQSRLGISDALSGMIDVIDIIRDTSYENLQILTLGSIPPNPTELLGSTQMEELLERLEIGYDYIIIDTPPVNVVSDSLSLVKMVDGVVIVVREGVTSHPNIISAITKYEFVEANILGFVLNGVTLDQGNKSKAEFYKYHNRNDYD